MDPAFAVGEDCEWLVRMLRPYRNVVFLSDCLYNYLVRSDSAVNIRKFTEARLTEIPAREKLPRRLRLSGRLWRIRHGQRHMPG